MIELKKKHEINLIEKASKIVAETLNHLKEITQNGITAYDLDRIAREYIKNKGGKPAFLGYRGYPAALCVSVNDEVIHGIPTRDKIIKNGDLVSLDLGVIYNDYYGDAAVSFIVGKPKNKKHKKLIEVTRESLYRGISLLKEGIKLGDISHAIGSYVFENKMDVLREFCGHGIGKKLHEEPAIFNFGFKNTGAVLKEGMVLAIEPMVTLGKADVYFKDDGWTVVTRDGSYAAHFEHTVCVLKNGYKILSDL